VLSQDRQVWAGGQQLVEVLAVVFGQFRGAGHDPRHQSARRRDRPFGVSAALVEVADQQVRAAGVAQLADLGQQRRDRHRGFGGQPAPQVVPVGIDEGAPVAGWTLQVLGGGGAGVALDRVQRPPETTRALQQAHASIEQFVHGRVPGPSSLVDRPGRLARASAPAAAVRDDGLFDRPAQSVPQVPAVADLHRGRCALADRFGVGGRAVAADDLRAGVLTQPLG
jgi:hypothetical protein